MPVYKVGIAYRDYDDGGVILPNYPCPDVPDGVEYKIIRGLRGDGDKASYIIETGVKLETSVRVVSEDDPVVTTRKAWETKHPEYARRLKRRVGNKDEVIQRIKR